MAVVQLPPGILRVGHPIPVALRDATGHLLVARGTVLADDAQRQQLLARGIYVDTQDSAQFRKALAGKLDSMLRSNALIGQIARAVPDAEDCGAQAARRRVGDPVAAWNGLLLRASALLHDPPQDGEFATRLQRIDAEALDLLDTDTDASLLTLIHATTHEAHQYSVTHAVLVAAVCELAARELAWPADRRAPLRRAALTMNLSMTALQDLLALQDSPLTPRQREAIDGHALRSAALLRERGIADQLWLQAVEQHHVSPAGPLAGLSASLQLARLIQRTDIFAARLAPRRVRQAMAATAAAKAAYLDENQQADAAGAAIIKAVGIYPPGSYVRLANAEVAVVLRRGRRANEPRVASVIGRNGTPLGEPAVRDTRLKPYEVTAGVAPHEVRLRLNLERLMRLS